MSRRARAALPALDRAARRTFFVRSAAVHGCLLTAAPARLAAIDVNHSKSFEPRLGIAIAIGEDPAATVAAKENR